MANEYVTDATLKLALNISDSARDDLLDAARAAASRAIDNITGRRFYLDGSASARVYTPRGRVVRGTDGDRLLVDDIGSTTGLIIETGYGSTWTTVSSDDYETGPDNAITKGEPITHILRTLASWPDRHGRQRVRVTARWGWPSVPDVVTQATLIQAARLFKRKESPEGVMGNAEWGVVRLSRVDPDVQALIQHLILPGFG